MYKQAVESTDVFLGIGGKDESSQSCEDLVVKVSLPEVAAISGKPCLATNVTQLSMRAG
jgi:hypothetical protein